MGFGTLGNGAGGYSSSSTSNLSALAPPFTVVRVNPKPNLNPFSPYFDPAESFKPSPWQYACPTAPESETVINSTGTTSGSMYDDYGFSAHTPVSPSNNQWPVVTQTTSNSFLYGADLKPYYSPYNSSFNGEVSPLLDDEVTRFPTSVASQNNYTHSSFDLEYGLQSAECWGFVDGKRVKRSDIDGSFSSEKANVGGSQSFVNQMYQGGHSNGKKNNSKEDYGVLYQSLSQFSDRENHTRSPSTELLEDKSCLEQNVGFIGYKSDRPVSSSPYPEFYPPVVSSEIPKNFPNYVSSCSPYEKCFRPVDTPFPSRASVVRASPSVVIRPPPATNRNLRQIVASRKPASSENVGGVHFGYNNPSKVKDSGIQSSSKTRVGPFDLLYQLSNQGNGLVSSTSVKEQPKDTSGRNVKARFGSQLPDIKVSRSFDSSEDSSDFIDHHSTAVDSPCWKGASSSQFSVFGVEAGNNSSHPEERKNAHLMFDSDRVFSKNVEGNTGKEHESSRNGALGSSSDGQNMLNNECNFPNNLLSVFDNKVSDTKQLVGEEGMTANDVYGADVAVHVAEKVLDSPASQEDATEHIIVLDPKPKLDVTSMIKAIHNLSDLLRFHLSSDACSLEEDNTETLKGVISNLNTCLIKKVVPESNTSHLGDTSEILRESHNAGATSGDPRTKSEAAGSKLRFDYLQIHGNEKNCGFPGKKDEKSPIFSPLGDDLDVTGNDDMTKAIKMVLDENFQSSEEMPSRALLFKSLWLEAEAKLCSISYKARFNRMKIQMEEIKHKAPQENEHIAENASQVSASSELAHNGPYMDPRVPCITVPSTSSHADDVDESVLARFNILKSRDGNVKSMNMEEEEQKPEMVDDAETFMARFNILKSQEKNSKSTGVSEGKQPQMIDDDSFLARLNILKSREEYLKSIGISEEKQPQMIDGDVGSIMARLNILKLRDNTEMEEEKQPNTTDCDFAGEKYLRSLIRGQLEDETLVVDQTPHQTANHNESNFVLYGNVSGYESVNEHHLSVANDPMIRSFNKSGSHHSSSSEWEHILKEDFSWKNL